MEILVVFHDIPDSKVHGANMGPTWGRQDPGGPCVGHVNLAIDDEHAFQNTGPLCGESNGNRKMVNFGVSGHYLENAWKEWPQIWHADRAW